MTKKNDDTRELRDALELAQHELKVAKRRVDELTAQAKAHETQLVRAPLEGQLREARARIEQLVAESQTKAREIAAAWQHEVKLRENEIRRLQQALVTKAPSRTRVRRCSKCRSGTLVAAAIADDGRRGERHLRVAVDAAPRTSTSRDRRYSTLAALVCGSCGFAEMYARTPGDLLVAVKKSRGD